MKWKKGSRLTVSHIERGTVDSTQLIQTKTFQNDEAEVAICPNVSVFIKWDVMKKIAHKKMQQDKDEQVGNSVNAFQNHHRMWSTLVSFNASSVFVSLGRVLFIINAVWSKAKASKHKIWCLEQTNRLQNVGLNIPCCVDRRTNSDEEEFQQQQN